MYLWFTKDAFYGFFTENLSQRWAWWTEKIYEKDQTTNKGCYPSHFTYLSDSFLYHCPSWAPPAHFWKTKIFFSPSFQKIAELQSKEGTEISQKKCTYQTYTSRSRLVMRLNIHFLHPKQVLSLSCSFHFCTFKCQRTLAQHLHLRSYSWSLEWERVKGCSWGHWHSILGFWK